MAFSTEEKLQAIEREIVFRKRVFKRLVALGKLRLEKATYETDIMREIATDYRERAKSEPAGPLFSKGEVVISSDDAKRLASVMLKRAGP